MHKQKKKSFSYKLSIVIIVVLLVTIFVTINKALQPQNTRTNAAAAQPSSSQRLTENATTQSQEFSFAPMEALKEIILDLRASFSN